MLQQCKKQLLTSGSIVQNLSFVLEKVHQVKFEDRPVPELKDPHDVLVNVKFTGICGSDVCAFSFPLLHSQELNYDSNPASSLSLLPSPLTNDHLPLPQIHYWEHGGIGPYIVKDPMVLGHESSGIVLKVGSEVTTLKEGDQVAMEPGIPCRRCPRCKEGRYNLCPDMAFAATPPHDGTLAKYYILPEDFCYKLPEGVSLEEGALIEPLSVAVHVTRQGGVRPGDSVVVFGAGPVGLLCAMVARAAFGAGKVIVVDIQKPRLEFAQKYAKITGTFEPDTKANAMENAQRLIKENVLEGSRGADVVIDASGAEPSVQTGIHVLRTGGTYVQGGMGQDEITFPIMLACTKELNVKGSFRYGPGDYKMAVELLAERKISVKELVTGKVSFQDAEQAFKDVKAGKGIKILIEGVKD